jgi:succinate-acetate transporter protein
VPDLDSRLSTETATRIVLRPIASPFALGFLGLAGASITLAGLELAWIPTSEAREVGLIVLIFGPALQGIACIFGFLGRDALAATGMGTLAAGWACVGSSHLLDGSRPSAALGTLLFAAAAGPLLAGLAATQTKLVPALVMGTTAVRWCLTAAFQVSGSHAWEHAAGGVGVLLAAIAVYGASSLELEDIRGKAVLPTLRRGRGRVVMRNELASQVEKLANEAGVREQL